MHRRETLGSPMERYETVRNSTKSAKQKVRTCPPGSRWRVGGLVQGPGCTRDLHVAGPWFATAVHELISQGARLEVLLAV